MSFYEILICRLFVVCLLFFVEYHLLEVIFESLLFICFVLFFLYFSREALVSIYHKKVNKFKTHWVGSTSVNKIINGFLGHSSALFVLLLLWGFHIAFTISAWVTAVKLIDIHQRAAAVASAPYLLKLNEKEIQLKLIEQKTALNNVEALRDQAVQLSFYQQEIGRVQQENATQLALFWATKRNGYPHSALAEIKNGECRPIGEFKTLGSHVCAEYNKRFATNEVATLRDNLATAQKAAATLEEISALEIGLRKIEGQLLELSGSNTSESAFATLATTIEGGIYWINGQSVDFPDKNVAIIVIFVFIMMLYGVAMYLVGMIHDDTISAHGLLSNIPQPPKVSVQPLQQAMFTPATLQPFATQMQQPVAEEGIGCFDFKIGVAPDGRNIYFNPITAPHTGVFGSTRSGKSACLANTVAPQAVEKNPMGLDLYLLDGKQADLIAYEGIPQVRGVAVTPEQCCKLLQQIVAIMKQRYTDFAARGNFVNLQEANENGCNYSRILIIIDELTAVTFSQVNENKEYCKKNIAYIEEIAQRGAGAGLHLIIGTQSPLRDSLPATLSMNLVVRFCFRLQNLAQYASALSQPQEVIKSLIHPDTFKNHSGLYSNNGNIQPVKFTLYLPCDYESRQRWLKKYKIERAEKPNKKPLDIAEIQVLYDNGKTMQEIANDLKVHKSTVSRALKGDKNERTNSNS